MGLTLRPELHCCHISHLLLQLKMYPRDEEIEEEKEQNFA